MLHLKSEEAIAYISRLIKSIKNVEERYTRTYRDELRGVDSSPAAFHYLNLLFTRHLELIQHYYNHGLGEAGVYIERSGFPSAPSLTADIRAIYDNLYQPYINLEERVKGNHRMTGIAHAIFRLNMSLYSDLNQLWKNPQIKHEMYEKAFFADFLGQKDVLYIGGKLNGKFLLDEEDGFFILSEVFEAPKKDFINLSTNNKFIREMCILSENSEECRNRVIAKYLDPSIYKVEGPILILITQGAKGFSSRLILRGYETKKPGRMELEQNWFHELDNWFHELNQSIYVGGFYYDYGPRKPFISYLRSPYSDNRNEDRKFFIGLLKASPECRFPFAKEKSNPEIIFDIFEATCKCVLRNGYYRTYETEITSLAKSFFPDNIYGKIAEEYIKRNIK